MNLAIRVSRSYDDIRQWCQELKATKICIFQHDADDEVSRTHVHMLVIGSEIKPDALKYRFKKLYGDIDKTDWSFVNCYKDSDGKPQAITEETGNKFITYMSKGHIAPSMSVGYDLDALFNLSQEWKDPKETKLQVSNGKFTRIPKTIKEDAKRKTKRQLIEVMCCKAKDNDILPEDTQGIIKMIRSVLVENDEVIGMYKVMDFYDAFMMYANKNEFVDMLVRKIEARIPRNNF